MAVVQSQAAGETEAANSLRLNSKNWKLYEIKMSHYSDLKPCPPHFKRLPSLPDLYMESLNPTSDTSNFGITEKIHSG